jgi:hypothetical protein
VSIVGSVPADAQSNTRPFLMSLWDYKPEDPVTMSPVSHDANADIPAFWGWHAQPATGPSIWVGYPKDGQGRFSIPLTSIGPPTLAAPIDWSRIVAVEFDEPYASVDADILTPISVPWDGTNFTKSSCTTPNTTTRYNIAQIGADLSARAAELKALAPKARFWVTLDSVEAFWITACGGSPLVFNSSYIDVVSFDGYLVSIDAYIGPATTAVHSSASDPLVSRPDQQVALIPGVFSSFPAGQQNNFMDGYFSYASIANQTCNLPLGNRGVTGIGDRCLVWMVTGFLPYDDPADKISGMLDTDQNAKNIASHWRAEVALPLSSSLASQRTPGQMIPPVLRLLRR